MTPHKIDLPGRRIAILATDRVEEAEVAYPKGQFSAAGAFVDIVSVKRGHLRAWHRGNWSNRTFPMDKTVDEVVIGDYDLVILPGGVLNSDRLRSTTKCVALVKAFVGSGKPVAAICHGPVILIETGDLKGRRLTSYYSIRSDIANAGAVWLDQAVVVDGNLVTSRSAANLAAFTRKIAELIGDHTEHFSQADQLAFK